MFWMRVETLGTSIRTFSECPDDRFGSSPAVPARQRRGGSTSRSGLPELDRADLKLRNLLAG
jgi:hypothetical protein